MEDNTVIAGDDKVRFRGEYGAVKRLERANSPVRIKSSDAGDERQGMTCRTNCRNGAAVAQEGHSKANR